MSHGIPHYNNVVCLINDEKQRSKEYTPDAAFVVGADTFAEFHFK